MPPRQLPRAARLEGYRKIKILGQGSDGLSWLCERRSDNNLVVRKSYDRWVEYSGRPLELHILQYIVPNHPRILYCEGWTVIHNNKLEVYYDYCKGGDLSKFMLTHEHCRETFIWHVFMQIADALAFLRESRVSSFAHTVVPSLWASILRKLRKANDVCRSWLQTRRAKRHSFPLATCGPSRCQAR